MEIYNNWTVLEYYQKEKYKEQYVLAKCLCGTVKKTGLRFIKSGKSKSCGCYRKGIGKPIVTNQMIIEKYNEIGNLRKTARFFNKAHKTISNILKEEGIKLYLGKRKEPVDDLIVKVCVKCGEEKPVDGFYLRKDCNRYRNECINCHLNQKKIYHIENSEHRRKYTSTYRKRKPEIREKWVERNPGYGAEYMKKYRLDNPEKTREHRVKNRKKKLKTDSKYRLKSNIRRLILLSFQKKGFKKNSKTSEILGIDYEGFCRHFESNFLAGMSWDNRGEWEIDHIIPVSLGKTEGDIIRLNHFSNLRPLWKKDNHEKSNIILDEHKHLIGRYIFD
jgi:hypothetical protein